MPSVFPYTNGTATTDAFSDPLSTSPLNSPSHSSLHTDVNTAVETIETILQSGGGSRNLLYNGAMQVAQRGTSTASITTSGYYTADRWYTGLGGLGTWTQTIENDAPTGSGFRKSWKMNCTTADASPAAGDLLVLAQLLEGQDLQAIRKGTAQAQSITLSFWVKTNVIGTYIVNFYDNDNTRQISKSYVVNTANTWEFKTLSFAGDTTGVWDNDNNCSVEVNWFLGAGSNFTSGTLATSWAAYVGVNRAVGQVNLASATNNYWQVTGVQLNVGSVAAPFEFKSFGQELRECQRYYEKSYRQNVFAPATGDFNGSVQSVAVVSTVVPGPRFMVAKRSNSPTVTVYSGVTTTANRIRITASGSEYGTAVTPSLVSEMGSMQLSTTGLTVGSGYDYHYVASDEL